MCGFTSFFFFFLISRKTTLFRCPVWFLVERCFFIWKHCRSDGGGSRNWSQQRFDEMQREKKVIQGQKEDFLWKLKLKNPNEIRSLPSVGSYKYHSLSIVYWIFTDMNMKVASNGWREGGLCAWSQFLKTVRMRKIMMCKCKIIIILKLSKILANFECFSLSYVWFLFLLALWVESRDQFNFEITIRFYFSPGVIATESFVYISEKIIAHFCNIYVKYCLYSVRVKQKIA